jgi:hypothetical protein
MNAKEQFMHTKYSKKTIAGERQWVHNPWSCQVSGYPAQVVPEISGPGKKFLGCPVFYTNKDYDMTWHGKRSDMAWYGVRCSIYLGMV